MSVPHPAIRQVIFDFGGVLVQWRPDEIARRFYEDEALRGLLTATVFRHSDWIDMDKGVLSESDAVERFALRMGRSRPEMRRLLQHVKDSLTPVPESFAIVSALAKRGVPHYGLSNMPASTFQYLRERYDCWSTFGGFVISGEVKMVKPDPQIFEHICRQYSLAPSETIFIDDHRPNVEAAAHQGFKTILFSDPRQCAGDLEALIGGPPVDWNN